jgi:predicted nucleotidyltransferase
MSTKSAPAEVEQKFQAALDVLVGQIKRDRSILAAVLCGSLSHDRVWSKSDIDLLLVTIDDKKASKESLSLYADGINVHAFLMQRAQFRKSIEGAFRNSFHHSLIAKGKLLYSHDDTIAALCGQLQAIGERDTQVQLLAAATHALSTLYKAHKWFLTRADLEYSSLFILYTANALAKVEVIRARLLADREVLPQAMKLNPAFFKVIYSDLLNAKKTAKSVQTALTAIDGYLAQHTPELFGPVIDHLREVGEARSATDIDDHFSRNFGIEFVTGACEYLADCGIFGKAALPAQLTKRSNVNVEELAFFYAGEPSDVY